MKVRGPGKTGAFPAAEPATPPSADSAVTVRADEWQPSRTKPAAQAESSATFDRAARAGLEHLNPGPLPPPPPPGGTMVGGVVIKDRDVTSAAAEARRSVELLTVRPDIQERLRKANVSLVVIPADKKLTDVPEFAPLRGTKTFDGRIWDDVRGAGGMSLPGGGIAVGVAEETLTHRPPDPYPGGYNVAMHELAHVIHEVGLPKSDTAAIDAAYAARKSAGGPWTEAYGSSNSHEYFAQGTNAYFGENAGLGQNGAAWVKQNDPALYAVLERIYGPPPK
jgi:hypothetical protein